MSQTGVNNLFWTGTFLWVLLWAVFVIRPVWLDARLRAYLTVHHAHRWRRLSWTERFTWSVWFVFQSKEDYGDPIVGARRREMFTMFFDMLLVLAAMIVWFVISAAMVGAQPTKTVPRIACIGPPISPPLVEFVNGLRELGYVDGVTMRLETRWALAEDRQHLDQLARDLVRLGVDVIATLGTPATEAALAATDKIPIVMLAVGDPVGSGFAKSLAHPGRNVTGVSIFTNELAAKQLEVLRDLIPRAVRIAILWNPANAGAGDLVKRFERAATGRGMSVGRLAASRPEELDAALEPLASRRFDALFVHAEAMFLAERQKILSLVASARVPTLYGNHVFVDEGGLASYGHDITQTSRRAAAMVDKILKGATPADLPVEEPTRFVLRINLKTAKTLGLTIPQSLLLRADEVIQ